MAKSTEAKPDGTIVYRGNMVSDPNAQHARCMGCGKIGTFWDCDCPYAVAFRDGKANAPRMDVAHYQRTGETVLVMDEEWLLRSQSGLRLYRNRPKKLARSPKSRGLDQPPVVNIEPDQSLAETPVNTDRKAYMREYMAKKRALKKDTE